MDNNDPRARDTETTHSSCPYPTTANHFPIPSTSKNSVAVSKNHSSMNSVAIGMVSPYSKDDITESEDRSLTEVPIRGVASGKVHYNPEPNAPWMNGISAGEPTHTRPAIGFMNLLADEAVITSCEPPPSYDHFDNPKNKIPPKNIPSGTSTNARGLLISSKAMVVPRTAAVPKKHSRATCYKSVTGVTFNGRNYVCTTSAIPQRRNINYFSADSAREINNGKVNRNETFAIVVIAMICLFITVAIVSRFLHSK